MHALKSLKFVSKVEMCGYRHSGTHGALGDTGFFVQIIENRPEGKYREKTVVKKL